MDSDLQTFPKLPSKKALWEKKQSARPLEW